MVLGNLLAMSNSAHAARLLRFEIHRDDQLLFEAISDDSGRESAAEVWSQMDAIEWEPSDESELPVQQEDPLRVLLSGRIIIRAKHAQETVLAEASVNELVLVRDGPESNRWRLPPEEVTRTGIAAGLGDVADRRQLVGLSPGTFGEATLLAAIALLFGLVIGGVLLVAMLGRSQKR